MNKENLITTLRENLNDVLDINAIEKFLSYMGSEEFYSKELRINIRGLLRDVNLRLQGDVSDFIERYTLEGLDFDPPRADCSVNPTCYFNNTYIQLNSDCSVIICLVSEKDDDLENYRNGEV